MGFRWDLLGYIYIGNIQGIAWCFNHQRWWYTGKDRYNPTYGNVPSVNQKRGFAGITTI